MAHRRGLTGSVRGMPCCAAQVSGRGVCMAGRRAGLAPRDLTPRPGTPQIDRPTWAVVPRPCLLEVMQHMLRAVGRPHREEVVIVVLEAAAATQRDEPGIPDLGEDHSRSFVRHPSAAGLATHIAAAARSTRPYSARASAGRRNSLDEGNWTRIRRSNRTLSRRVV